MNAISASILIFLIAVVLAAPRRWAILGMAAGVLYLTEYASIAVLGFNLFPMRFLEMAGFVRVMVRREFIFSNLNELDRLFLLLYCYSTIVFLLRSTEGQAYAIGAAVDATLCYFIFRGLIRDMVDFRWFLRALVILFVPYVALLFVEMRTGQDPFSILGGGTIGHMFRGGRVRCVGSFREPSILGSLGASFLPLYIGLSFSKPDRSYAITGILLCLAIVGFSNSGGPMAFALFGLLGWALWSFRDRMRLIRRVVVISIAALALVMEAPIWYLPTHITFLTGGDAWHRSYLIDIAVRHLREWWLWGMPIAKTSDWFPYTLGDMGQADITNQFIGFGIAAGLMAILLFVWLLTRSFRSLGKTLAADRLTSARPSESEYLLWGLGVMLIGHINNFIAISYFDQFYVIWLMQLALISTLTHPVSTGNPAVPSVSTAARFVERQGNLVAFPKH